MARQVVERATIANRALQLGYALTDRHWEVLDYVLEYYACNGRICTLRGLIKGKEMPKKEIYDLFPGNPIARISNLTGLPKPEEC
jgi:tRNA 2-thiouridine synthesizing protein E